MLRNLIIMIINHLRKAKHTLYLLNSHLRYKKLLTKLDTGYYGFKMFSYTSQFASPELAYDYIHNNYNGEEDPNWYVYGSEDSEEYAFWAPRSCGVICTKMIVDELGTNKEKHTIMDMINLGIELGGYKLYNNRGEFIDLGWMHRPLVNLGSYYNVHGGVSSHASIEELYFRIADNQVAIASVSPQIGERNSLILDKGGHLVVVYGMEWEQGKCKYVFLNNPSGRYPELRSNARINADRFKEAYAERLIYFTI